MDPTPTSDDDWLADAPHTAVATVDRRRPPPDPTEAVAGDAQAYALIDWLRANPVISWHSSTVRDWCRRNGLPTKGPPLAEFMDRVRRLFADAHAEHPREVVARLITSAEDVRLHAMAGSEPDLGTALGCLKLQADLLLPKRVAVAHAFLTPPSEGGKVAAADISRLPSAQLEALAKSARDREAAARRTADAAMRAAVPDEDDDDA